MKPYEFFTACLLYVPLGFACSANKPGGSDDFAMIALLIAVQSRADDFAQPPLDTAIILLGDDTQLLTNVTRCYSGFAGVSASAVDSDNLPVLSIYNTNFGAKTASIGTEYTRATTILHVDVPGGIYDPVTNCETRLMENSREAYDIQASNCALQTAAGNPDPATNLISFRVRCNKS